MTTTGSASLEQPLIGKDGKYQIRIESYDPARNTMKAIWLVSRNQRLLSQLLDKCEVSNSETSNEALRGNLLSVQRELQELRQAMDHHDGTQTPVLDTCDLGIERNFEDLPMFDSTAAMSVGGESTLSSGSVQTEDAYQAERSSSAFGFGASNRRRSVLVLSRIPQYPRPSIRTDFCISSFEPFPSIRERPSKIPKCPPRPPPPAKKKKGKKPPSCVPPRPKTSLSGRGSRMSSYGDRPDTTRSILKTSPLNKRPATSMALTRSVTKKVSFGDPIEEPKKSCQSRLTSCEKKKSKTSVAKTKTRQTEVRPATSLGVRTIPRSSSRMSRMAGPKSRSGRLSAMEMSSKKSQTSQKSTASRTELGTRTKCKIAEKATTTSSKKTGLSTTSAVKSGGVKSGRSSGKSIKSETKKAKQTVRSKSALGVPSVRHPDVLPFESPPPQPKLLSQPQSLGSLTENASEDSASAMIRSVSIIDDDSDLGDPFDEVKRTLPRIRVGDGEPSEYKVKAYFLDELDDFPMPAPFDSGVIPSSPVEVDATAAISVQRDASLPEPQPTTHVDVIAASIHDAPSSTVLETGAAEQTCNNTDGVKVDAIKIETSVSESAEESASIEASRRDPKYETTSFPELGMDFLPEFENEVNGLLDTLMSQDLLTNTFSQDLRLFSTESNFMESYMDANEPSSSSQRFSEQEVLLEDTTKEAIQEENETLQTIVEDAKDLSLQTTVAAPTEPVTVETQINVQIPDTLNKDHSTQDVMSETEGDADNNDVDSDLEEEDTVAVDIFATVETEKDLSKEEISVHHLPSESMEDPLSCINEGLSKPTVESLRRKSTGSHDAAALSISVADTTKPCGHRRSASHNELDAMMTNNDGYAKQTPSPGISKEDGANQQQWSGESAADPLCGAETCSMFSSSELTVPDSNETYHDVHHGYSPSFATTDMRGENLSRQMALVPSPRPPRQASFDFLSGNRRHLRQSSFVDGLTGLPKSPILPTSTFLRYESESSGDVLSAEGGEFVEIEELSTFDVQSTVSRDLFLKHTEEPCDAMWEDGHNKEHEMRPRMSEEESEGEQSVIQTTLYLQTDDFEGDHLDEVPSVNVTMNEIRPMASSRRSLASPANVPPQNNSTPSKGRKRWFKTCGLFRLLTCTSTIEKTDVC